MPHFSIQTASIGSRTRYPKAFDAGIYICDLRAVGCPVALGEGLVFGREYISTFTDGADAERELEVLRKWQPAKKANPQWKRQVIEILRREKAARLSAIADR